MVIGTVSTDLSMDNLVDTRRATISAAIYSHPDIYERELDRVFGRSWLFVGHESQIPRPGDLRAFAHGRGAGNCHARPR